MRGVRGREANERSAGGRVKPSGPVNLLLNPSFEVDLNADGVADSWSLYNSAGSALSLVAGSGLYGAKAQNFPVASVNATAAVLSQFVPVRASRSYTLLTYLRINSMPTGAVNGDFVSKVEWYLADKTTLITYPYTLDTTVGTWRSTSTVFVAPSNAGWANVILGVENGGNADLDFASFIGA